MAPLGLMPAATLLGKRVADCAFNLVADLPAGIPVAGRFLPARGRMRLRMRAGRMRLEAEACLLGGEDGAVLVSPHPSTPCHGEIWRIRAEHRPWVGEFIEPARAAVA